MTKTLAEIDAFYTPRLNATGDERAVGALAPDYSPEAKAILNENEAVASFGCGDPLAFAGVRPGDTVLDLGSGAGLDLLLAAERVGPTGRVIGVDMSEAMIERASAAVSKAGVSNVELMRGEIEALPVADQSVDWVISNCVINLSADKPAVFREIHRVLKPGGRILISDLVADDLPDWVQDNADLYAACISGVVSENAYSQCAADVGLADLRVVDRLTYDANMVRVLVEEELPAALDDLAGRMNCAKSAMIDMIAQELSGKVTSIKLAATKPA